MFFWTTGSLPSMDCGVQHAYMIQEDEVGDPVRRLTRTMAEME
jgi:hypothetical protein